MSQRLKQQLSSKPPPRYTISLSTYSTTKKLPSKPVALSPNFRGHDHTFSLASNSKLICPTSIHGGRPFRIFPTFPLVARAISRSVDPWLPLLRVTGRKPIETILSVFVCPRVFPRTFVARFPIRVSQNRLWVRAVGIRSTGRCDLKGAEIAKSVGGIDATGDLEATRLNKIESA